MEGVKMLPANIFLLSVGVRIFFVLLWGEKIVAEHEAQPSFRFQSSSFFFLLSSIKWTFPLKKILSISSIQSFFFPTHFLFSSLFSTSIFQIHFRSSLSPSLSIAVLCLLCFYFIHLLPFPFLHISIKCISLSLGSFYKDLHLFFLPLQWNEMQGSIVSSISTCHVNNPETINLYVSVSSFIHSFPFSFSLAILLCLFLSHLFQWEFFSQKCFDGHQLRSCDRKLPIEKREKLMVGVHPFIAIGFRPSTISGRIKALKPFKFGKLPHLDTTLADYSVHYYGCIRLRKLHWSLY